MESSSLSHRLRSSVVHVWSVLRRWTRTFLDAVRPGPSVARGAAWGAFATALLGGAIAGPVILRLGLGWPIDVLAGLLVAALLVTLSALAVDAVVSFLAFWPRVLLTVVIGSAVLLGLVTLGPDGPAGLLTGLWLTLAGALIGGSVTGMRRADFRESGPVRRAAVVGRLGLGLFAAAAFLVWAFRTGSADHLTSVDRSDSAEVAWLDAGDPSEHGPYVVDYLTYGSGADRRRSEFGSEVDIVTDPVDASAFVEAPSGLLAPLRTWYWGFDHTAYPINGRVWMPEGDGPFPLVLMVHGNHQMAEYSDPGYAYLGELLAGRGAIAVSVDQNFLNGSWMPSPGGENDARGWLLLEHLARWRAWTNEPGHTFYGKADMDRIVLIGHSRGGEAVTEAVAFNRLSRYPDDATVPFEYGFGIRGIVAIAPVDNQYDPAGQSTPIEGVSYFLIHGGHDADVSSFVGDTQYRRVALGDDPDLFKASLYVYRANHGQFNTVWGDMDAGLPAGLWLNRAPLLSGEEQRHIAGLYIGAFVEVVLHEDRTYLPLFRDFRTAGDWLPEDLYINRYEEPGFRTIADFEEDVNVESATLAGARIEASDLAVWREADPGFRQDWGKRDNQVAVLGWRGEGYYAIHLPAAFAAELALDSLSVLSFALAELDEDLPDEDADEDAGPAGAESGESNSATAPNSILTQARGSADEEELRDGEEEMLQPLDLTVEMTDGRGSVARVSLRDMGDLLPPLRSRFTRWSLLESRYGHDTEPVLQTFLLPISEFLYGNPDFDPSTLVTVRFVFDGAQEGVLMLDEVGLYPEGLQ